MRSEPWLLLVYHPLVSLVFTPFSLDHQSSFVDYSPKQSTYLNTLCVYSRICIAKLASNWNFCLKGVTSPTSHLSLSFHYGLDNHLKDNYRQIVPRRRDNRRLFICLRGAHTFSCSRSTSNIHLNYDYTSLSSSTSCKWKNVRTKTFAMHLKHALEKRTALFFKGLTWSKIN